MKKAVTAAAERGVQQTVARRGVFTKWSAAGARNAVFWSIVCLAALFLREPNAVLHPQLWAEDGPVFFLGAQRGFISWLDTYNGYYHLLPRIIASLSMLFDPAYVPHVFVYGALLVTAIVASRVFSTRIDWPHRPLLALAIVLVPHSGEVFFNPTNIQWISTLALIMTLLMRDPESTADWIADIGCIVLTGLTGPFSVFVAPLYFWRAFRRRTISTSILTATLVVVAALQGWQLYRDTIAKASQTGGTPFLVAQALEVACARIPLALFGAQGWISNISPSTAIAAGLCILGGIAWICALRDRVAESRAMLVVFLVPLMAITFLKIRPDTWPYQNMEIADRYFYLPKVVLLWVLISSSTVTTWRGRVAYALMGCVAIASFPVFRFAEKPPDHWADYVPALRNGQAVNVVVNPGFGFVVPAKPWASFAARKQ